VRKHALVLKQFTHENDDCMLILRSGNRTLGVYHLSKNKKSASLLIHASELAS
jgi:hypothetical protein